MKKIKKSNAWKKIKAYINNMAIWNVIDRSVNIIIIVELIIAWGLYEKTGSKIWFISFWLHIALFFLWDVFLVSFKQKLTKFTIKLLAVKIFKQDEAKINEWLMTVDDKQLHKIYEEQQNRIQSIKNLEERIIKLENQNHNLTLASQKQLAKKKIVK